MSEFIARKLNRYTFKKEKTSFRTAIVFKDGKEYLRMAASEANEYCEKWNGRKGNFDIDTGKAK